MSNKNTDIFTQAFQMFCKQVENSIEEEIPNWLDENPYWEIDDEDCNGNRTFRYPPTNRSDARSALCESFIEQGEDMGFGDFFEFVLYHIYGEAMSKNNVFRQLIQKPEENKPEEKKPEPTPEENATLSLIKFQKHVLDKILFPDGLQFPSIKKTEGGEK